jgi:PAS domain S-box-containing protein
MSDPHSATRTPADNDILIVEDNRQESDQFRRMLEGKGYAVRSAANGREGLDAARLQKPRLIISDVMMPWMNGYELCRALKDDRKLREVPVILLTTLDDPADIIAGLNAPADFYLTKPFAPESLLSRVSEALLGLPPASGPLEIKLCDGRHEILSGPRQMLALIISLYESCLHQKQDLSEIRLELQSVNGHVSRDRDLLRTLIDTLPDSIYVKDADGRYILDNLAHMRRIGAASTDDVVGKTVFDFFPKELAERFHADDDAILRSGEPLNNREEPIVDDDGTRRWISTTKVPFRDAAGRILGLVCLSRDISEEKRAKEDLLRAHAGLKEAHENLRALQLQLVDAEKMKSIGRLAAGVAHEVKNPLAIITMGIEYLAQLDFGDDPSAQDIIREVSIALKRADHVVRSLLDFSAPKQLEVAEEDMNAVIEEALALTRGILAEKEIDIVRELAPDLPPLRIDREKISQVLVNVLTNAADAVADSGGRITVRTFARPLTGVGANIGDARSEVFRAGDLIVTAEIEDNGPGIPADQLEKIFDPFFTTKPTGQGTGLGLTVSKTIMDVHGGVITVSNRAEGGARVTLMLKAGL